MFRFASRNAKKTYKEWSSDMIVSFIFAIASLLATTQFDILHLTNYLPEPIVLLIYYVIIVILSYPVVFVVMLVKAYITTRKNKIIITGETESDSDKQKIFLLIHNRHDIDIRNCYARMTRLLYKFPDDESAKRIYGIDFLWINHSLFINLNKNYLTWPAYDSKQEKIIRDRDRQRIDIAEINNDSLYFIFENEKNNNDTSPGDYFFEIKFGGYINNEQIDSIKFRGLLTYKIENGKHLLFFDENKLDSEDVKFLL